MDPTLNEWLNLALRWAHIITGIAWIGSSFFFNWLDSWIEEPESPREGIEGELWMVHSGGFYRVEKMLVAPAEIPRTLHWFVWEATFTLITGFFLLGLIYYLGADVYLVDPSVADIGTGTAIALGIGTLVVGWLVYDGLWRSPLREAGPAVAVLSFVLLVAVAYALGEVFSARAAYVHVGALMGTVMVVNVWVHIIPAQRQLVEATRAGGTPDAALAANAKQRSTHNNYMTLPVVFIMVSGHYPGTYGHAWGWLVLAVLALAGAGIRHAFNLRNKKRGRQGIAYAAVSVVAVLALMFATAPRPGDLATTDVADEGEPVTFAQAQAVIAFRCVSCHSAAPSDESFDEPPAGVAFDRTGQIKRFANRIYARAVISKTMPLGNSTEMTQEERDLLARWVRAGAPGE